MPCQRARRPISDREWQRWKPQLHHLYLEQNHPIVKKNQGRGAEGVQVIMERDYEFFATKNQYEIRFKKWKWFKNQTSQCWQAIAMKTQERTQLGKDSIVLINGKQVPTDKLQKETSRVKHMLTRQLFEADPPTLPEGVVVLSPVLNGVQSFMLDLPFRQIEDRIQGHIHPHRTSHTQCFTINPQLLTNNFGGVSTWARDLPQVSDPTPNSMGVPAPEITGTGPPAASTNFEMSVWQTLRNVVPVPMSLEIKVSQGIEQFSNHVFASSFYRCILFSISNNFAGLGAFSIKEVVQYLEQETTEQLHRMIRSLPGYSSKAIIRNLFIAAIEYGDERIVTVLLNDGLDPNKISRYKSTPLERACSQGHNSVIRTLLGAGADVNRTPRNAEAYHGPLSLYLRRRADKSMFDHEVVTLLLEADRNICIDTIESIFRCADNVLGKSEVLGALMHAMEIRTPSDHHEWTEKGIFHQALALLDETRAVEFVGFMQKIGVDLNRTCVRSGAGSRSNFGFKMIEVAARRGALSIVKDLLRHGAVQTHQTLTEAINSQNANLVSFLLEENTCAWQDKAMKEKNVARALGTESVEILKLLVDHGALERRLGPLDLTRSFPSQSMADMSHFVRHLMEYGYRFPPDTLAIAVAIAIQNGHEDIAEFLIDVGASTKVWYVSDHETPLSSAVEHQSLRVVRRLLDAGADPNQDSTELSPLTQAIKSGNHAMIELLVSAGANVDNEYCSGMFPLIEATANRDEFSVKLLLECGANVNQSLKENHYSDPYSLGGCCTALAVAVKNGDMEIVNLLLDYDADCHSSDVLLMAASLNEDLVSTFLKCHNKRYPMRRKNLGTIAMVKALELGRLSLVETMLEHGADATSLITLQSSAAYSTSPFGYAIGKKECSAEFLGRFLELVPDCTVENIVSDTGVGIRSRATALLAAIGAKDITKVELLLNHGANVNRCASLGVTRTPLQRACEVGNMEIVQILLLRGANVNGAPALRRGGTALQLAAIKGYIPIVSELLARRADVNAPAPKPHGRTALQGAAEHGRLDMVKLLLDAGAGADGKDIGQIERARSLAQKNGFIPVSDMLRDWRRRKEERVNMDTYSDLIEWDL